MWTSTTWPCSHHTGCLPRSRCCPRNWPRWHCRNPGADLRLDNHRQSFAGSQLADATGGTLTTQLRYMGRFVGAPLTSQAVIVNGDWHRVGFVWDGSNRILYADGAEVGRDTCTCQAAVGPLWSGQTRRQNALRRWHAWDRGGRRQVSWSQVGADVGPLLHADFQLVIGDSGRRSAWQGRESYGTGTTRRP